MYQRFVMVYLFLFNDALRLFPEPKQQAYPPAQNLIGKQKEYRCHDRHNDDHNRRHYRFIPRRPGHLCGFRPDLLDEFEGICLCHF